VTGERPSIRVATMNVLGPANADWDRRLPVLARGLRAARADVVALQEVPVRDTQGVVDTLLGPGYHVTPFTRTSDDGVAGAIATRWPHRVVAEVDQRDPSRGDELPWAASMLVRLATPVGQVLVAHHKPSWPFPWEAARERQAVRAALAVEEHVGDGHAVLLGDLDATPDAASTRFLRGRQPVDGVSVCYQDAWETVRGEAPGWTFDAANPLVRAGEVATAVSRRIDWILVRSGLHGPTLRVASCSLLLAAPVDGVWASDHYGVVADLAVPGHPPGNWASPQE
jgi:endonuclease/exonuclease/phosphatase family metal-dependent hydrolase